MIIIIRSKETAQFLASRGAIISLADINADAVKSATKTLPGSGHHMYTVIDVRDRSTVYAWIESTMQRLGKLDGAVNMAGVITPVTIVPEPTGISALLSTRKACFFLYYSAAKGKDCWW